MHGRRSGWWVGMTLTAALLASCTSTQSSPTTLNAVPTVASSAAPSSSAAVAPVSVGSVPSSSSAGSVSAEASTSAASSSPVTTGVTAAEATTSTPTSSRGTSARTSPTVPSTKGSAPVSTATPAVTVPTVVTSGLSASEIADRTAIQAVWVKYWETSSGLVRMSPAQRVKALKAVTVDPETSNLLAAVAEFTKNGWDNYGSPGHRLYWGPPVDGSSEAILGDCMDFSKSGRIDVKSGIALTVGVSRSNIRGSFVRTVDGLWKVTGIAVLGKTKC